MPPSPPVARAAPSGFHVSRTTLIIGLAVALAGGAYLLYRSRQNAAAASTSPGTSGCPDGTAADATGDCVQISTDYSGQIGTLQSEIGNLQSSEGQVTVPNVVGLSQVQASQVLTSQGLKMTGTAETAPKGTVYYVDSQSPAAGTAVAAGSTVTVAAAPKTGSGGGSTVTVPDVTGLSQVAADAKLSAAGLKAKGTPETAKKGTVYYVTATSPKAGAKVARGSTVTLTAKPR